MRSPCRALGRRRAVFVVFVQLLDENGARVASPEFDPYVAHLGPAELLGLYRDMIVVPA